MLAPASVTDYRLLARRRLPRPLFDYIEGGSYEEITLRANRADLDALKLRQRVMRDVSQLDTITTVLGQKLALPVILAPCALAGMLARRGEVQAARAAHAAGVPFCLSTVSICPLEEVQAATGAPFWFQLYVIRDRGYARELLQRAQAAGCDALVFTVDLPLLAARYRDTRSGLIGELSFGARLARAWELLRHVRWLFDVGVRGRPLVYGNFIAAMPDARDIYGLKEWVDAQFDASMTWRDLGWIREHWQGPIVIKGVLDAADAREAAAIGADAVVVSNHGGRQLDGAPSTIAALPAIADAVGDRLEVLMDGGVRTGADLAKALALGARACLIGRPWLFALGARGGKGVAEILAILKRELEVTLALLGVTRVDQLDRSVLL